MPYSSSTEPAKILEAATPAHFDQARELMLELMTWDCGQVTKLGLDGARAESFYYGQGELRLPGEFAPPEGLLLLALEEGRAAGCGAFSKFDSGICEL
jgi:hypothetical protein